MTRISLSACRARVACLVSKRPSTWGSGLRFFAKSVPRPFASGGAWFMTFLTSTPGSMSIRVEGGP